MAFVCLPAHYITLVTYNHASYSARWRYRSTVFDLISGPINLVKGFLQTSIIAQNSN